jgi:hypothetical protein
MDFELIDSPSEIPPGVRYILLMRGPRSVQTRHSRGITIMVENNQGNEIDNLREMLFLGELDHANGLPDKRA